MGKGAPFAPCPPKNLKRRAIDGGHGAPLPTYFFSTFFQRNDGRNAITVPY
jgi:hypothetical protein